MSLPEVAYWFAASDKLSHGDGRKIVLGETLTVDPPLVLCQRGLHCSADPFNALKYAPGPLLYKVCPGGEYIIGDDKICSTERTTLDVRDATQMLEAFVRAEALSVIHLWNAPTVVRQYLETGDETLRAAALAAARAAALAAAWDVARAAARAAAQAAAWDAAWDAARAAARAAALAAARQRFNVAVTELFAS